MINRRKFLQSATLAGSAGGWPFMARAGTALPALLLHQVVHDSRYPQSLEISGALLSAAVALNPNGGLRAVDGDITRLWLDELQPQWGAEPTCLAGVTGADVLFCLEQLAADHNMRVFWRQEQDAPDSAADQALVSWLIGPRSLHRNITLNDNKKHNNWSLG